MTAVRVRAEPLTLRFSGRPITLVDRRTPWPECRAGFVRRVTSPRTMIRLGAGDLSR
ncbi:hypothetical protein J2853_008771 [Streptosporangium lutulentum]|uniref:Uncharacterized protein n=1 Tax=Streptosporangium lutulentum TaxID=1461250 RepID=A0ABT9QT23_9ACTN|nr:hypothetical protein [Streptosporangium lutulentum]